MWAHRYVVYYAAQPEHAERFAGRTLDLLRDLGAGILRHPQADVEGVVEREWRMVFDLKGLGRFEEARRLLEERVLPDADLAPELEAEILLDAAEVERRLFRWERAEELLGDAHDAIEDIEHDFRRDLKRFHLAIGRASLDLELGLPERAALEARRAEQLVPRAGSAYDRALLLYLQLRLAYALQRTGEGIEAWERFLESRDFEVLSAPPPRGGWMPEGPAVVAQLRVRAALCLIEEGLAGGTTEGIEPLLEEALAEPGLPPDERALAWLLLAHHRLDRGTPADEALRRARELLSGAGDGAVGGERRANLAALELRACQASGGDRETLAARAAALEEAWSGLLDGWSRVSIRRTGHGPLFFSDRRAMLAELVRARLALADGGAGAERALEDLIRAQALGTMSRELGARPPTLAEVRALLVRPRHGLLVYLSGRERSHVFALDAQSLSCHELDAGGLEIDRARAELLLALGRRHEAPPQASGAIRARAAELASLVLPLPLLARAQGWESVCIVGAEVLGYLPFELLPGPSGTPLGAELAVSYLPTLPVAAHLARRRGARPPRSAREVEALAAVCTDPDRVPEAAAGLVRPIALGPAQRRALERALAPAQVELVTGPDSRKATLARALEQADDLALLVAHGLREESRDAHQGLLLGGGDVLWGEDLEACARLPRLVVAAACSAGRGSLRRGDDGRHLLSGSLLLGGADAAILPSLDVEARAALVLCEELARAAVSEGLSAEQALRDARRAVAARLGPDAWDAHLFHLVGLGDTRVASAGAREAGETTAAPGRLLLAGAAVALAGLGALLARRRGARGS